ncbi:hypothetical protein M8J76_008754 [Diaphorina citri]|nr:hypothetical protein M8J76_008754 [Diaphorina citri]
MGTSLPMSNPTKNITFVTGNNQKLEEFIQILGSNVPFRVIHKKIDLPELQGEIDDICKKKCEKAIKTINDRVIVEDTCLCFNALRGLPGPYVKWFLQKIGPFGLYKMLAGFIDKSAKAICTFAFGDRDGSVRLFRGEAQGKIVKPRGRNMLSWDSCFQPDGFKQTYGEMPDEQKNQVSYRYKAALKLKDFFMKMNANLRTNSKKGR